MPKMADAISHLRGKRMVSTSGPPDRRKTAAELAAMSHVDRLHYDIFVHPETSADRQARYEREVMGGSEMTWDEAQRGPDGE